MSPPDTLLPISSRLSPRLFPPQPTLNLRPLGSLGQEVAAPDTRGESPYLWRGVIPLHQVSIIAGAPGCGKSLIALDIAARHSARAPFPGESACSQGGPTLIFAPDDHPEFTLRPRLRAAGADSREISILADVTDPESGETRPFNLFTDHAALQTAILAHRISLVIIDPLDALLTVAGPAAACRAMRLLNTIAQRTRATIIATAHTSPDTRSKYRRLAGPLALTTAARVIWEISEPQPGHRTLLPLKWPQRESPVSFSCTLSEGRLIWTDQPAPVVKPEPMPAHAPPEFEVCCRFLENFLADGPRPTETVVDHADARYISRSTLTRAVTFLNITRTHANNQLCWALPADTPRVPDNSTIRQTLRAPAPTPTPPQPSTPAPSSNISAPPPPTPHSPPPWRTNCPGDAHGRTASHAIPVPAS